MNNSERDVAIRELYAKFNRSEKIQVAILVFLALERGLPWLVKLAL